MKKLRQQFSIAIILIWAGIGQIYWQLSPHISTYTDRSTSASLYQIINGITVIGIDLLVIFLGRILSRRRIAPELIIGKGWLNTLSLGLLSCVIVGLISYDDISANYLDALLPFLRNTYPLIFGSFIGLILCRLASGLSKSRLKLLITLVLVLFTTAMFVSPNGYGWSSKTNTLFYALLFFVGWFADGHLFKLTKKEWLVLGCLAFVVNCILQYLMPIFSIDGSNNDRFTTTASVLPVLISLAIIRFIPKNIENRVSLRFIFSYLVLIESTGIAAYLVNDVRQTIGGSSLLNGILTLAFLVFSLVVSWLWCKIVGLKVGKNLEKHIDRFVQQPLQTQEKQIKRQLKQSWPILLTAFLVYFMSFAMMVAINDSFTISINNNYYNTFAYILGQRELQLLMTSLIIFAEIKFVQMITRRYWVSLAVAGVFNVIFAIAGMIKGQARQEPILPSDLNEVNGELLQMVNQQLLIITGVAVVVIIAIVILLERKFPVKISFGWQRQVFYVILLPLLLGSSLFWNHENTPLSNFMYSIGNEPTFYSQLDGAKRNGPTIQFLNNIDVQVMRQPKGYSKQAMEKLVKKYRLQARSINKTRTNTLGKQTIIFNLSESFANPSRVPGVKLKNNPIPYITKLEKQSGGLMISSGYGGGTANMEFMTLTGFSLSNFMPTLSIAYTQLVPKLKVAPSIVDSFKYSSTIHPYYGGFYSRIEAYQKFGFNKFVYLGSKYKIKHKSYIDRSPYLSDKTAYANTLDQINQRSGGQFINLITMQNHMPFDEHYYNYLKKYNAQKASSGTEMSSLNEYLTEIHYTDNAVKKFIKQIDQINKPITIVFYGDHLPGIYGNSFAKDGVKLHETDYFIYSNKYARQHGARNLTKNTRYTDPNSFIAMVAKQTNSKVNWYQALLTDVYEKMPVNSLPTNSSASGDDRNQFINQKGKIVKESKLTKKQKQLWHDYKLIQYDITSGKQYTAKYFK